MKRVFFQTNSSSVLWIEHPLMLDFLQKKYSTKSKIALWCESLQEMEGLLGGSLQKNTAAPHTNASSWSK